MTSIDQSIVLGLGELTVTNNPSAVLVCLGLGSCIAVSVYDPHAKVGGMAHIVLSSGSGLNGNSPAKYADTGIPLLLEDMRKKGAITSRMVVKIVGGAKMSTAPGLDSIFDIGEKNLLMTKTVLAEQSIRIVASDTGGHRGRTVRMSIDTGKVIVSSLGGETKEL